MTNERLVVSAHKNNVKNCCDYYLLFTKRAEEFLIKPILNQLHKIRYSLVSTGLFDPSNRVKRYESSSVNLTRG